MLDFLQALEAWHWLLLGIVLLGLESLGVGGFLMGAGFAAFATCLLALADVGWPVQFGVFAILSVLFTVIYWKKFRKFNEAREGATDLNNRMAALVGKTGTVVVANGNGVGKVQIGDTLWEVRCEQDLQEGEEVRVAHYRGTTLLVNKVT